MLSMTHDIRFKTNGKLFKLNLLASVEIQASVESLVDTAVIVLPESVLNKVLHIEDKVQRGSEVVVKFGYNSKNKVEFIGYVTEVVNKGGALEIRCEDALYLFRKSVPDKIFKPAPVKDVLEYLVQQVDPSYSVVMDVNYGITYEKFTIYQAEAYDVLKKLQEELKANIFFDTERKELNFFAPYKTKFGEVKYDFSKNVESSTLEYKSHNLHKLEVIVESTAVGGDVKQITLGTPGGEKVNIKVGPMSEADMKKVGDTVLANRNADRYEGDITGWLVPRVAPGASAKIIDADYPERDSKYYVTAVTTSFSANGGVRTVKLGIKL